MALLNTKKSAIFVKDGATLPTPPANFLEVGDELVINPSPTIEEFTRISGKLGTTDSYADVCHATFSQSISHKMRSTDTAATALATPPEYGELLKICGFTETIDTSTPSQETVTYTNTQTPTKGSGVIYVDGKKYTATNSIVGDATFTFEVGKSASLDVNLSAFIDNNGVPTNEATPSTTLSDEPCLVVACTDLLTAGGTAVKADRITIAMGADIQEFYTIGGANGLKAFDINDYVIKLTADFYVDSADYADAITKLNNETVEAIDIKIGTNASSALVSGKSVHITAPVAKANAFTDSTDKSKVKRSFTWLLTPDGSNVNLSIKHGYFA